MAPLESSRPGATLVASPQWQVSASSCMIELNQPSMHEANFSLTGGVDRRWKESAAIIDLRRGAMMF